jgi:hypothetical protein
MTDKTYPQLDAFDGLTGAEICALHQDGRLVRLTLTELAQWIRTAESIVRASEPFEGVLARRTSTLTGVTFPLMLPWQDTEYDTMGFWSGAAPTRLTVPAGVTKVRLSGAAAVNSAAEAGTLSCSIRRNGATEPNAMLNALRAGFTGFSNNGTWAWSPVLPVAPGDYFEMRLHRSGMPSVSDLEHDGATFFALEVVEKAP